MDESIETQSDHIMLHKENSPKPMGEKLQFFLGFLPFFWMGLAVTFITLPLPGVTLTPFMLIILIFLVLIIPFSMGMVFWGWLKGSPRWFFPWLFLLFQVTFLFANSSTPGLVIFHKEIWGRELWGWRAAILPGVIILLAVVFCRLPWRGLKSLVTGAVQDWSRLSFGILVMMIWRIPARMDEVADSIQFPATLTAVILIWLSAILYLRFPQKKGIVLVLIAATFLATLVTSFFADLYWKTHEANLIDGLHRALNGNPNIWFLLNRAFASAANECVYVLAPALLMLLRANPPKPEGDPNTPANG